MNDLAAILFILHIQFPKTMIILWIMIGVLIGIIGVRIGMSL